LTLGGLLSKHDFLETIEREIPGSFQDTNYRPLLNGFGVDEENVRDFIIDLLKSMNWQSVVREHDVLAKFGEESLLVECKRYDSRLMYIDEHKGGGRGEAAIEELQRNLKRTGVKWGLLTDGVTFRFIYNAEIAPDLFDCYVEFSLKDMIDSTHRWPFEMNWLVDFLLPVSLMRRKDPTKLNALPQSQVSKIVRFIKADRRALYTSMKTLAVAAMEDMGVRPLHTGIMSIRSAKTKHEFLNIFRSIESDDPDFHREDHYISEPLCGKLHEILVGLAGIDLSHVDHEFFGIIYQKVIKNGNASHYTNSKLSREMANYVASRSEKTQMPNARPIFLEDDDFILDPALGSGQLLRGLLPFHRVFFRGNSSGIDGWRRLARHFMGRDIDENAIWIAKINVWLATADKGESLLKLDEFRPLDVISATINRRAGETIRQAFKIDDAKNIAGCVSNPPWDAFKNDSRRGVSFDAQVVEKIKRSLSLNVRQLNRAQIFLRIVENLGVECRNMRFAVILPDSIFVDKNDEIRNSLRPNLDFYFSFPRNVDPATKKRIFGDVDNTRKFGIIFGRSSTVFAALRCYPFGTQAYIDLDGVLTTIGSHNAFPLFSHSLQAKVVREWKRIVSRFPKWKEGEFHQTSWAQRAGRTESATGTHRVIGGSAFCDETNAWSRMPIRTSQPWKRMSSIADSDTTLATQGRTLFSDYINNSKKLNSASYTNGSHVNVINTIMYSTETLPNDWLIYDSAVFSTFVELYGTSQHINAWRLQAIGLPPQLTATAPLEANVELIGQLDLSMQDALDLYEINRSWLGSTVPLATWQAAIANLPAGNREKDDLQGRVRRTRRRTQTGRRRSN
jgi:hypothetical protein